MRAILSLLVATAAMLATHLAVPTDHRPVPPIEPPRAEAAEDDPEARARRELMMVRDPATGSLPMDIHRKELEYARALRASDPVGLARRNSGLQWIARGPNNVGGRTRALAIDVSDTNVILAGAASGGIWRSSDGGATWMRTTTSGQYPGITCLVQDTRPGKNHIWYAGTGEPFSSARVRGISYRSGDQYPGDGIYKSTDGGRSWARLESTASGTPHLVDRFDWVFTIAIDPTNLAQDEVYAAVVDGIVRSSDGGTSWTLVHQSADPVLFGFPGLTVAGDGKIYAAFHTGFGIGGVWRSVDGLKWTNITPSNWPSLGLRWVLASAPSNPSVLYVLGATLGSGFRAEASQGPEWNTLWKYTYRSGDGSGSGGQWEDRSNNLPAFGGLTGDFVSQSGYDLLVSIWPNDENMVFIGGTNLWRSADGFASRFETSWVGGYAPNGGYFLYENHHPDQHALAFLPGNPDVMFSGSDGGVHRTEGCLNATVVWRSLNAGYRTAQFYTVAIDPYRTDSDVIVGGTQDNGTHFTNVEDAAKPWVQTRGGDGAYCAVAANDVYYLSSQRGVIYRYTLDADGGLIDYTRVDPTGATGYQFINPFTLDPADHNVMYLSAGPYLWRNTELSDIPSGSNFTASEGWSRMDPTDVRSTPTDSAVITAIGVSQENPNDRLYYGTSSGRLFRIDDAREGDATPFAVNSGEFPRGGWINCVTVDPRDADRAIVVFSNYNVQSLFLTTDGGSTWTAIGGNLEEHPDGSGSGPSCRWVSILRRPNGMLYFVGTSTGLYSTNRLDGAATQWTQEGAETIGGTVVPMVVARQSDGYVVAATHGAGVFSAKAPTLAVGSKPDAASVTLESSVPNPARSSAMVGFTVPPRAAGLPVSLTLHDVLGVRLRTLHDQPAEPGRREVRIDLAAMPSGTYFYRLRVGEVVRVGSVRVVR